MRYFKGVTSFNDLKEQYKTLLKANHPDNGGDEEVMKLINIEYDALFPIWKNHMETDTDTIINETSSSSRRKFYTEFGWEGSRYDSELSLKEIAQIVRTYVKEKYPDYKFSVRTSYASMCSELHVVMKESPIEIYKPFEELTQNDIDEIASRLYPYAYNVDKKLEFLNASSEEQKKTIEDSNNVYANVLNEATRAVVEDVDRFVKSYNYDDSDGMTDYFDVNFYYFGCCQNNGGNVSIVPKTAKIAQSKNVPEKTRKSQTKRENETKQENQTSKPEQKKRFAVTETSDAYAPGEDFAVWDNDRNEYYHDQSGTVYTFARKEQAEEYLKQVEDEQHGQPEKESGAYTGELPNRSIGISDMHEYGYIWNGMLPLNEDMAQWFYKKGTVQIFCLYKNGSESIIESSEQLKKHAENDGIFGIHKEDWETLVEPSYFVKKDLENESDNMYELGVVYHHITDEPDFDEISDPVVHTGHTLYRGSFDQCVDYLDKLNKGEITKEQIRSENQEPKRTIYYAIDEEAARRAKEANSYSDYVPESATKEYRKMVDKAIEIAEQQKISVDSMYHEKIDSLLDTYAWKLAENMNSRFSIDASMPSFLITGGGHFSVHKKEKQNAARDRNMEEWQDIQGLLEKIRSTGKGGISSDDPEAVKKLNAKLEKLQNLQETMKAVNAYYRKNKTLDGCPDLSAESIDKLKAEMASQWHYKDTPFLSWELSNNNAEIRRVKERIDELLARNNTAYVGWEFDGGRVDANQDINRLQIIFDKKPDENIRESLKKNRFRWSPKNMAWQRQLNDNAIYAADRLQFIYPLLGKSPLDMQKEARSAAEKEKTQNTVQNDFGESEEIQKVRKGR